MSTREIFVNTPHGQVHFEAATDLPIQLILEAAVALARLIGLADGEPVELAYEGTPLQVIDRTTLDDIGLGKSSHYLDYLALDLVATGRQV